MAPLPMGYRTGQHTLVHGVLRYEDVKSSDDREYFVCMPFFNVLKAASSCPLRHSLLVKLRFGIRISSSIRILRTEITTISILIDLISTSIHFFNE